MRYFSLACVVFAAAVSGCAPVDPAYEPGSPTTTIKANDEQQFNLYAANNRVPIMCQMVLKDDPVGFARDESGSLQAVAGQRVYALSEGSYQWKRLPQINEATPLYYHSEGVDVLFLVAFFVPALFNSHLAPIIGGPH